MMGVKLVGVKVEIEVSGHERRASAERARSEATSRVLLVIAVGNMQLSLRSSLLTLFLILLL